MSDSPSPLEHLDVLIVGAGLSGIGAAWHIGHDAGLERWAVVEAHSAMGGTWDLFRYPGIRSDSDMFTLGYRFHPWRAREAIADGPAILAYIEETAERYGIEERIRFQHRLLVAEWSSGEGRGTVTLEVGPERRREQLTRSFICGCTGCCVRSACTSVAGCSPRRTRPTCSRGGAPAGSASTGRCGSPPMIAPDSSACFGTVPARPSRCIAFGPSRLGCRSILRTPG